ncbi:MAG: hypothetical protein H6729_17390 [Deltaproteobacteria bacterium]|nr:hypothetical protein [Deltaproteobacteria bacterium]
MNDGLLVGRRLARRRFAGVALGAAWAFGSLAACSTRSAGDLCGTSADCSAGASCLFDVSLGRAYCTTRCLSDDDCPSTQFCRGDDDAPWCVERVRACGRDDPCNGLDDDCDGVVDGVVAQSMLVADESTGVCEDIEDCLDDDPCGAFVCTAPPERSSTVCRAAMAPRSKYGALCTIDEECPNGECVSGVCAAFCRPDADCGPERICAEHVGAKVRPRRNACQRLCLVDGDCSSPAACVWRQVYESTPDHASVCAVVDPNRKPLGTACTNNVADEGDVECQSGLCRGRVCTRFCSGASDDCADVGADFACETTMLYYGTLEFRRFVCVSKAS